jgi:arsenate reductase
VPEYFGTEGDAVVASHGGARIAVKRRVLFICTHNSARSQMAEGFLRSMVGDRFDVASAGTEPDEVRPEAVVAMRTHHIDISSHAPKSLDRFLGESWDYVITVCDAADEKCPVFPGGLERLHWSFPDPSAVHGAGRQAAFDDTASRIEERIRAWLAEVST